MKRKDGNHCNGYDCKNGKHTVKLPHGQSVKLCDKCFKAYQKGTDTNA